MLPPFLSAARPGSWSRCLVDSCIAEISEISAGRRPAGQVRTWTPDSWKRDFLRDDSAPSEARWLVPGDGRQLLEIVCPDWTTRFLEWLASRAAEEGEGADEVLVPPELWGAALRMALVPDRDLTSRGRQAMLRLQHHDFTLAPLSLPRNGEVRSPFRTAVTVMAHAWDVWWETAGGVASSSPVWRARCQHLGWQAVCAILFFGTGVPSVPDKRLRLRVAVWVILWEDVFARALGGKRAAGPTLLRDRRGHGSSSSSSSSPDFEATAPPGQGNDVVLWDGFGTLLARPPVHLDRCAHPPPGFPVPTPLWQDPQHHPGDFRLVDALAQDPATLGEFLRRVPVVFDETPSASANNKSLRLPDARQNLAQWAHVGAEGQDPDCEGFRAAWCSWWLGLGESELPLRLSRHTPGWVVFSVLFPGTPVPEPCPPAWLQLVLWSRTGSLDVTRAMCLPRSEATELPPLAARLLMASSGYTAPEFVGQTAVDLLVCTFRREPRQDCCPPGPRVGGLRAEHLARWALRAVTLEAQAELRRVAAQTKFYQESEHGDGEQDCWWQGEFREGQRICSAQTADAFVAFAVRTARPLGQTLQRLLPGSKPKESLAADDGVLGFSSLPASSRVRVPPLISVALKAKDGVAVALHRLLVPADFSEGEETAEVAAPTPEKKGVSVFGAIGMDDLWDEAQKAREEREEGEARARTTKACAALKDVLDAARHPECGLVHVSQAVGAWAREPGQHRASLAATFRGLEKALGRKRAPSSPAHRKNPPPAERQRDRSRQQTTTRPRQRDSPGPSLRRRDDRPYSPRGGKGFVTSEIGAIRHRGQGHRRGMGRPAPYSKASRGNWRPTQLPRQVGKGRGGHFRHAGGQGGRSDRAGRERKVGPPGKLNLRPGQSSK
jgi:hypothetical protein